MPYELALFSRFVPSGGGNVIDIVWDCLTEFRTIVARVRGRCYDSPATEIHVSRFVDMSIIV